MPDLPAQLSFFTCTGKLVRAVLDSVDAGTDPDMVALQGQLTFSPEIGKRLHNGQLAGGGRITVGSATPPLIVVVDPVPVALLADGSFSVKLLAPDDPDIAPSGWSWTVTFALTGATIKAFSFTGAAGSSVDLANVAPVEISTGGATFINEAAASAAAAAASAASAAASASLVGAPADEAVAAIVGNPASATSTELSSTYLGRAGATFDHRLAGGDEPDAFLAWTADDGYDTQADLFATLTAGGVHGTLFLSPDWVDRAGLDPTHNEAYITTAQVQGIIAGGHEIGAHGNSHEGHTQYLAANGAAALDALLALAITNIEAFGTTCRTGSYPGGQTSERVLEIVGRRFEFYRSSKGVVSRNSPDPYDVPCVDIFLLTEAACKLLIDEAVANRSMVALLLHGDCDAAQLTKVTNLIAYANSLGVRQGSFYEGMSERTLVHGSRWAIDALGSAFFSKVRTNRLAITRADNLGESMWFDIDEATNAPYFDADGGNTFEFRKPLRSNGIFEVGQRRDYTDVTSTIGSATVSSASAGFTAADIGRTIAGVGIPGGTTILAVPSPTTATMSANATGLTIGLVVTVGRSIATARFSGEAAFYTVVKLMNSTDSPKVDFYGLNGTQFGNVSATAWTRSGSGGTMAIDTGTGGSYLTVKAYGEKLIDYLGVNVCWRRVGNGSPEGVWAAPVGSMWHRADGGAGTSLYIKESGAATNVGWVAK